MMFCTHHLTHGILLIAQPLSSSRSSMLQLGQMSGVRAIHQELPCRAHACYAAGCYPRSSPWFSLLGYGDVCDHDDQQISRWVRSRETIFMQHVPPTPQNQERVLRHAKESHRPIVILTRNPYDALHSLCERELQAGTLIRTGLHGGSFAIRATTADGSQHVRGAVTLQEALRSFKAWDVRWTSFAKAHPAAVKLITYEAMVEESEREKVLVDALTIWRHTQTQPMQPNSAHYVHQDHDQCALLALPPLPPSGPPLSPPQTCQMKFVGRGSYCSQGYYAGWVANVATHAQCMALCLTEKQCWYAALADGLSCTRYNPPVGSGCAAVSDPLQRHALYRKDCHVVHSAAEAPLSSPPKHAAAYNPKRIVFVTGLPHSGTTLVERFLAQHEGILELATLSSGTRKYSGGSNSSQLRESLTLDRLQIHAGMSPCMHIAVSGVHDGLY